VDDLLGRGVHLQLQVVNSLSTFLEGHGSRVIDVEDDIEERELDL
jgi:hypothetical protein